MLPGSCFMQVNPKIGLDKVVHVVMFACFAFFSIWGYRKQFIANGKTYRIKAMLLTLTTGIVLGASTEIIQGTFIPGRDGNIFDLTADILGTIFGLFSFEFLFKNKKLIK